MSRIFCPLLFLLLCSPAAIVASPSNVGFYYGREAPIGPLFAYDWLVLQQSQVSDARLDLLGKGGTVPISYVSVDEMARSHRLLPKVPAKWRLGENRDWDSVVLDLRLPEVREFLLSNVVAPALERGFQGVFLDTLDSHRLTDEGQRHPQAFAEAQASFIRAIKTAYPTAKLIINRGFHLPESAHAQVDALAFESYRSGYDAAKKRYRALPQNDRNWLDGQLAHWRASHPSIPIIAIDYAAPGTAPLPLADALRADGFIPVVSNGALDRLSPTQPAVVPRHVLVVHDLPPERMDRSQVHQRLGVVLERLGLVPVYRSSTEGAPKEPVSDRYRAIVIWWESGVRNNQFCQWLSTINTKELPIVTMGMTPTDPACRSVMRAKRFTTPTGTLTFPQGPGKLTQFEAKTLPRRPVSPLPVTDWENAWLTASDGVTETLTPVYLFPGGGVAVDPFLFESGPDDAQYWLFDPARFLRQALDLGSLPAIDSTTETGRRILTAHIDGDGFVSRAEMADTPLSGEMIRTQILNTYRLPHTVSVIEGETAGNALYPDISVDAEREARTIFRHPNVEVASHTYSHPFFWQPLEGGTRPDVEQTLYGYAMSIPGYSVNLEREITGAVQYVNELAPSGKPVRVFLWSGDARPGPEALARVRALGLVNVNGGNTQPLPYGSELAAVWPDARPVGDELQIYAPTMNENVYTNLWTGPFYGYRNARESFKLLEEKGRIKPIGIYYHFYSGTKPESLHALHDVYRYAISQNVTPLFLSDYARRVQTQYYSVLRQNVDGTYSWRGIGYPSTIRLPQNLYPDLVNSEGVAGFNDAAGQRFIHLATADARLALNSSMPEGPYLASANAPISDWRRRQQADGSWRISLSSRGHIPLELALTNARSCKIVSAIRHTRIGSSGVEFRFDDVRVENLVLECR